MLTPGDIHRKEFKSSLFGGYNVDEVNEFLDEIIRDFEFFIEENSRLKQEKGIKGKSGVSANYCPNCGYHLSDDRN